MADGLFLKNKILKMIKSNTFTLCFFCLFLFSCSHIDANFCPSYPIAGEKVAKELEQAGNLPNTWEWIGRINKLREELELCQKR